MVNFWGFGDSQFLFLRALPCRWGWGGGGTTSRRRSRRSGRRGPPSGPCSTSSGKLGEKQGKSVALQLAWNDTHREGTVTLLLNHIKSPCLICASLRLSPGLILYSAMVSHTGLTSPLPKVLLGAATAANDIGGDDSVVVVFTSPVLMWPRSSKNILHMFIIQDMHDYYCKTV